MFHQQIYLDTSEGHSFTVFGDSERSRRECIVQNGAVLQDLRIVCARVGHGGRELEVSNRADVRSGSRQGHGQTIESLQRTREGGGNETKNDEGGEHDTQEMKRSCSSSGTDSHVPLNTQSLSLTVLVTSWKEARTSDEEEWNA